MLLSVLLASWCVTVLSCTTVVHAQSSTSSTETYEYDVFCRLISVTTDGGSNDGVETEYDYDDADNRTQVTVTGASTATAPPPRPPPPPPPDAKQAQAALEADCVGRTNSGIWDLRAASNAGSFSAVNIVGGLPALTSTNGGSVQAVNPVTGARLSSQQIQAAATGDFVVYPLMRKDPDHDSGFVIDHPWPVQVRYIDGNTGSASGADIRFYESGLFGTPYATLDAFHDALNDDAFHAVRISNLMLTDSFKIGRTFNGIEADVIAIVAIDISEANDLQATETLIVNGLNTITPN